MSRSRSMWAANRARGKHILGSGAGVSAHWAHPRELSPFGTAEEEEEDVEKKPEEEEEEEQVEEEGGEGCCEAQCNGLEATFVGDVGDGSLRESLRRHSPIRHCCKRSIASRASEALGTRTLATKQPFGVTASEMCSTITCSWKRARSFFFSSLASIPGSMLVTQTSTKATGEPLPNRLTALIARDFEGDPTRCAPGVAPP